MILGQYHKFITTQYIYSVYIYHRVYY